MDVLSIPLGEGVKNASFLHAFCMLFAWTCHMCRTEQVGVLFTSIPIDSRRTEMHGFNKKQIGTKDVTFQSVFLLSKTSFKRRIEKISNWLDYYRHDIF